MSLPMKQSPRKPASSEDATIAKQPTCHSAMAWRSAHPAALEHRSSATCHVATPIPLCPNRTQPHARTVRHTRPQAWQHDTKHENQQEQGNGLVRHMGAFAAGALASCIMCAAPQASFASEQLLCQDPGTSTSSSNAAVSNNHTSRFQVLWDLSGLFGEERDPVEPFTLFGTTFKKFVIETLDGEKIISRKRGFTVDTCIAGLKASEQTPQFQFLPEGEKVRAAGTAVCEHAEGDVLGEVCLSSCEQACTSGLDRWAEDNELRTGFRLLEADRTRLLRSCSRECAIDCTRPGKSFSFSIPYRR